MKRIALGFAVLFLMAAPTKADYQDAADAYRRGDYFAAARELHRLAGLGNSSAQYSLGVLYRLGRGVQKDTARGIYWYRRAALQGHKKAQSILSRIYYHGYGVPSDYKESARWSRLAAEQGDAKAQNTLGNLYRWGRGVLKSQGEAVRWYRLAAGQGLASAQANLAYMYSQGLGVPKDSVEVTRWYRMSADQGNATGQYNLGVLFMNGRGVKRSYREAMRLFRKAAKQKQADATYNLGVMYERGWGTPPDLNQAYRWYEKAASLYSPGVDRRMAERARERVSASRQRSRAKARTDRAITGAKSSQKKNLSTTTVGLFYISCASKPDFDRTVSSAFSQQAYCLCAADEINNKINVTELISIGVQMSAKGGSTSENAWKKSPKLRNIVSVCTANNLSEDRAIYKTQRALNLLGYNIGPVDGRLGRRTKLAIRQLQMDQRLAGTGHVSDNLANEIQRLAISKLTKASRGFSRALAKPRPQRSRGSSGSGFAINRHGDILTNNHVVENCKSITVGRNEKHKARVVARDAENDLAVVRASKLDGPWARLSANARVEQGERIIVFGYPLQGALSSQPSITTGIVSGLAGLKNDIRHLQITAPVQQGNSGGPLLNKSGNVIGIVTSKLDAYKVAKATGDIPQNVNFAIKASVVGNFLGAYGIQYEVASATAEKTDVEIAKQAREFTTLVECR